MRLLGDSVISCGEDESPKEFGGGPVNVFCARERFVTLLNLLIRTLLIHT